MAACLGADQTIFFPDRGGSTKTAREVCGECAVQVFCLEYAIHRNEKFGIWGGLAERERRKLRRIWQKTGVIPTVVPMANISPQLREMGYGRAARYYAQQRMDVPGEGMVVEV